MTFGKGEGEDEQSFRLRNAWGTGSGGVAALHAPATDGQAVGLRGGTREWIPARVGARPWTPLRDVQGKEDSRTR